MHDAGRRKENVFMQDAMDAACAKQGFSTLSKSSGAGHSAAHKRIRTSTVAQRGQSKIHAEEDVVVANAAFRTSPCFEHGQLKSNPG